MRAEQHLTVEGRLERLEENDDATRETLNDLLEGQRVLQADVSELKSDMVDVKAKLDIVIERLDRRRYPTIANQVSLNRSTASSCLTLCRPENSSA